MSIQCALIAPALQARKPNWFECTLSQSTSGGGLKVDWNGMLLGVALSKWLMTRPQELTLPFPCDAHENDLGDTIVHCSHNFGMLWLKVSG